MTQITKQEAARIAGLHEKTLERHIKDFDFRAATGYHKNPLSKKVTFDEQKLRTHVAGITGERIEAIPEAEPKAAIVKADRPGKIEARPVYSQARTILADAAFHAFLVPHKIYLPLDEAKALTGFPKSELQAFSELKYGRRVIKRSKLEKI